MNRNQYPLNKKPSQPNKSYEAARGNARLRIEQWAKNPACVANTVSVVRNVKMADVAKASGLKPTFGQSPFAIARGNQFEKTLFRDSAAILVAEMQKKNVLPEGDCHFHDLRLRTNGGVHVATIDDAIEESKRLLSNNLDASKLPLLCAGLTIRVPKGILLPEAILIIDAVVIRLIDGKPTIYVGEIKTYPDRGGHTDSGELATARAQAGMYVHGLELAIRELELQAGLIVSRQGILVLTRPGSNQPSVRADEDLRYQVERARRGFELLEKAAAELGPELWACEGDQPKQSLLDTIIKSTKSYSESCLGFCDMAPRCFEQALQSGDPIILGETMKRFLGEINLVRAVELFTGDSPKDETERDLVKRLMQMKEILP